MVNGAHFNILPLNDLPKPSIWGNYNFPSFSHFLCAIFHPTFSDVHFTIPQHVPQSILLLQLSPIKSNRIWCALRMEHLLKFQSINQLWRDFSVVFSLGETKEISNSHKDQLTSRERPSKKRMNHVSGQVSIIVWNSERKYIATSPTSPRPPHAQTFKHIRVV